jgi:acetylornithine deacetylase/succinyl-diaminopimelate desuccinylase-like protein
VVRFAPIRLSKEQLASVHSVDENMDILAVGDCVVFYRRLLEQYEA